jgi:hypothetical protein
VKELDSQAYRNSGMQEKDQDLKNTFLSFCLSFWNGNVKEQD